MPSIDTFWTLKWLWCWEYERENDEASAVCPIDKRYVILGVKKAGRMLISISCTPYHSTLIGWAIMISLSFCVLSRILTYAVAIPVSIGYHISLSFSIVTIFLPIIDASQSAIITTTTTTTTKTRSLLNVTRSLARRSHPHVNAPTGGTESSRPSKGPFPLGYSLYVGPFSLLLSSSFHSIEVPHQFLLGR